MKLIYHDETIPKSYEQVYKDCQRGYGIKRPDKVSGFAGFFYRLPDVYAYGMAEKWAENSEIVVEEFRGFIKRFRAKDYGFVTRCEHNNNVENRWLAGTSNWTIGRYSFSDLGLASYGGIVLEFFDGFGLIYSIEEDMSKIYEEQYNDAEHENEIQYVNYQDIMYRYCERHPK